MTLPTHLRGLAIDTGKRFECIAHGRPMSLCAECISASEKAYAAEQAERCTCGRNAVGNIYRDAMCPVRH